MTLQSSCGIFISDIFSLYIVVVNRICVASWKCSKLFSRDQRRRFFDDLVLAISDAVICLQETGDFVNYLKKQGSCVRHVVSLAADYVPAGVLAYNPRKINELI